jgi:ATP-binding cassette subfamily B protein
MQSLQQMEWKNIRKRYPMELLIQGMNFLSYMATWGLAVWYLYQGEISIGGFAATLSALHLLDSKIGDVLRNVGKVLEEGAVAGNYFSFLEMDEKCPGNQPIRVHPVESIQFTNVSFTYPSVHQAVIDDLSLTIRKGETIAVVGLNGAGKTTFVKLLLGLIHPTVGKMMYNGVDIAEIDGRYVYEGSSALFQTFGKYQMTIRENVALSEAQRMEQMVDIKGALDFVGFDLDGERFPQRDATLLGREFGGTDLSGGQWQLLALARAYFRDNDLIILDEPTAAIDPLLENEIFKSFHSIAGDKTAIIVTHRLGVTKLADRILVFENGRVIEDGSHEQLMGAEGKYARLFHGQSDWYNRNESEMG